MSRAVRLAMLGVALSAAAVGWSLLRPGPDEVVTVTIARGSDQLSVLRQLHHGGLIPSVHTARLYLAVVHRDRSVRWGRYRIPPHSTPVAVLHRLLRGRVQTVPVTVPEGLTLDETMQRMIAAGIGDRTGWSTAVTNVSWIETLAPKAASLEGYLFPDTYHFAAGTSAAVACRHMVRRFMTVWDQEIPADGSLWGSPHEVVTLASLVQAESGVVDELDTIAGVFLNRLERGMLLQCDPTVVYALKQTGRWDGRLLRRDLEINHPYNTYRRPGLPPGPINSPGRRALRGAARPEGTSHLYFVAKPGGGHTFSRTLAEHNRAVRRLRRSRR